MFLKFKFRKYKKLELGSLASDKVVSLDLFSLFPLHPVITDYFAVA
jgi:hypothetical protein